MREQKLLRQRRSKPFLIAEKGGIKSGPSKVSFVFCHMCTLLVMGYDLLKYLLVPRQQCTHTPYPRNTVNTGGKRSAAATPAVLSHRAAGSPWLLLSNSTNNPILRNPSTQAAPGGPAACTRGFPGRRQAQRGRAAFARPRDERAHRGP